MEYHKGNYDYSQQQQYPSIDDGSTSPSVMLYPGPGQQGPPPTLIRQQYIPTPTMPLSMPEANQNNNNHLTSYNPQSQSEASYNNNNQYNPQPEVSYNNNQYTPQPEVSYNSNQYNPRPEASYNNNQYNPRPEVSYNSNQYNPRPEASYNSNQYNPQSDNNNQHTYNSPPPPPPQTFYSSNSAPKPSYTTPPNQPPNQHNNNVYSNTSPYLTKPYPRTQNYNNTQSQDVSPPSAPDKSPKPPKNYHSPNSPPKPITGPSPYVPPPNQSRPAQDYLPPDYERTKRPRRDECDCADCFSICGCIRCTCTLITFIIAALFIAAGIVSISYSKILPGQCQNLCPNGVDISSNVSQQCSNISSLCRDSIFKVLFYGGIGLIGIGVVMALSRILCMCCRVGSSGGRGTGCCYCC